MAFVNINMQISYSKKDCEEKDVIKDLLSEIEKTLTANLTNPLEIRGGLILSFNKKE